MDEKMMTNEDRDEFMAQKATQTAAALEDLETMLISLTAAWTRVKTCPSSQLVREVRHLHHQQKQLFFTVSPDGFPDAYDTLCDASYLNTHRSGYGQELCEEYAENELENLVKQKTGKTMRDLLYTPQLQQLITDLVKAQQEQLPGRLLERETKSPWSTL